MSFFNKAKEAISGLSETFGEEVLGEIKSSDKEDPKPEKPKKTKRQRKKKKPRTKRREEKESSVKIPKSDENLSIEDEVSLTLEDDIEVDDRIVQEKNISDILSVLQVDEAINLPQDVIIPKDFRKIKFDKSTLGYDIAQVESFKVQVRSSIKTLIDLHDDRNEDIAKLASYADRLQADNRNLLYEAELSQGVSVMPTQSNAEVELAEAQATILGLRARVNELESNGHTENHGHSYNDHLSILEREKEELQWENQDLRKQVIDLESKLSDGMTFDVTEARGDGGDDGDYFTEEFYESTQRIDDQLQLPQDQYSLPQPDQEGYYEQTHHGYVDQQLPSVEEKELPQLPGLDEM